MEALTLILAAALALAWLAQNRLRTRSTQPSVPWLALMRKDASIAFSVKNTTKKTVYLMPAVKSVSSSVIEWRGSTVNEDGLEMMPGRIIRSSSNKKTLLYQHESMFQLDPGSESVILIRPPLFEMHAASGNLLVELAWGVLPHKMDNTLEKNVSSGSVDGGCLKAIYGGQADSKRCMMFSLT